ncbi:alpha-L-arabinofuranosidase C-terminal domain-containing protein [Halalkalibacter kiskunsagensis]|uniref:Alpha-L-arabinofuranosidase C-terminal domain-containing protein n=1 Tax=Halalkalibacter kiskunsagensis TaxID=1548599 RepID=A0ABV6KGK4_9BACI
MEIERLNFNGRILTATSVDAHNTFEKPENVKSVDFTDFGIENNQLFIQLPPM